VIFPHFLHSYSYMGITLTSCSQRIYVKYH